ncbi:hypothetical protein MNBD_GAMMA26-269 [hydrothermal vent metagenome]|uniref:DUF444 family protein n=1 Tax=hydrothermal vent metagenome TaxID=652676 RepID=A0A3B1B3G5_9ZZZZ
MDVDRITSDESEGFFNDFVDEQLNDLVEDIINDGDLDRTDASGSDLIVEMDDIEPPTLVYGDQGGGGAGGQGSGEPGNEKGKLKFAIPFERFMELAANKLRLPDLTKEGKGKIKEITYQYKTFGPVGVILDKKRTFKRALKSSIGTGIYQPEAGRYDVEIRRNDRRYKVPQREERPKYKAVVFYMGDISYSTFGERLELEKRLLNFVHHWLDFNYGKSNVEHRFFVHDVEAYEVTPEQFYNVSNIGGTRASLVFDLVSNIAFNEYDAATTNFYGFYVGDGELFGNDAKEIVEILKGQLHSMFNRLALVEVQPSRMSCLNTEVAKAFSSDRVIRTCALKNKNEIVKTIRRMFEAHNA